MGAETVANMRTHSLRHGPVPPSSPSKLFGEKDLAEIKPVILGLQ